MITARLRRTGVGRTTIGVRDNPEGASGYTVDPDPGEAARVRARRAASPASAGALLAGSLQSVPLDARTSASRTRSLLVAIVVIGGLGSIAGPDPRRAVGRSGCPAFFPGNELVPLLTSSVGLLVLLLLLPGWLRPDRVLGPRRAARASSSAAWGRRRPSEKTGARGTRSGARERAPAAGRRARARGAQHHRAVRWHHRGRRRVHRGRRRRDRRADRHQRRRQEHADERDRRLRAEHRARSSSSARACRRCRRRDGRGADSAARSRPRRSSPS